MSRPKSTPPPAARQTQARAPKGGLTVRGVFYPGGRMLPAGVKVVDRSAAARKAVETRRNDPAYDASASARKAWETRRNKEVDNG